MANTYTQIYIQIVFAVQRRSNLIKAEYKEELQKYMTGIIRNKKQKLIAINIMPDHAHIFIGLKPNEVLLLIIKKSCTSKKKSLNSSSLHVINL